MLTSLTIAEPVAAWLQTEPRRLRVHSAFPEAINLVGNDSQFLTLLAQDADDGPFALRLACPRLPDVRAGASGRAAHGTIFLGPLVIDWRSATRWDPTLKPIEKALGSPVPVLGCLHESDSILVRALHALSPLLRTSKVGESDQMRSPLPLPPQNWGGLRGGWPGDDDPSAFQAQLDTQAASHLAALWAGLQGDDAALAGAIHSLLGFGQGLTPAGDDCLLGVLAARRMSGQPAGLLEATVRASASRTTSLSAAFLQAACAGQFAGHWHRLRDALASEEAAESEEAVRRILTHGSTSGTDALVGWMIGLAGSAKEMPDPSRHPKQPQRTGSRRHRYIKFFKPYGVLSQFTDEEGRPTIGDYVDVPNVYAAGRLDKNSEGLMLLTDDGWLNHRLTHPRYEHPKTYLVQVEGTPVLEALSRLRHGVEVKGELTRPAEVELLRQAPDLPLPSHPVLVRQNLPTAWLRIVLREGRKRQIRQMTASVGHPTLRLVRVAIGPIMVYDLEPGEWRDLTPHELRALRRMVLG
ncbi:MAG: pseudouridine synthase [Anaerolineae bacterium]